MRNKLAESNQQIIEDVLPEEIEKSAVPIPLDTLKPWHKPRKQFVREYQWMHLSKELIEKEKNSPGLLNPAEGSPEVRYLTLPGIDYLDVRLLAALCDDLGCCLTSTGFLSGDEKNPQAARAKVREDSLIKAGHITGNSHTFNRRFEDIIPRQGQAYKDLLRKGPFHIVNIDMCGSIAAPTAHRPHRPIDAIHRIVEFQLRHRPSGWLLFVTTDARYDSIDSDTLNKLYRAILDNVAEDESFRHEVQTLFGEENTDIETVIKNASSYPGEKFLKVFSLSLSKWLLHLSHDKKWNIKTHKAYCYSTETKGNQMPTMACLAFEFLPPPNGLPDRFGITLASPRKNNEPTDNTSIRAIEEVSGMTDLDQKMESCNGLRLKMVKQTRELLKEAGYADSALKKLDAL